MRLTDHVFMGLKIVHLMIYNSSESSSVSLSPIHDKGPKLTIMNLLVIVIVHCCTLSVGEMTNDDHDDH